MRFNCRQLINLAAVLLCISALFFSSGTLAETLYQDLYDYGIASNTLYRAAAGRDITISRSADLGRTYTEAQTVEALGDNCSFIRLFFSGSEIRLFWITQNRLFFSKSGDGGSNWTSPVGLYKFDKKPSFIDLAAENNYLCLAFTDKAAKSISYRESPDLGVSWGTASAPFSSVSGAGSFKVKILNGYCYAASVISESGMNKIILVSKPAGGTSWSTPREIFVSPSAVDSFDIAAVLKNAMFLCIRSGNSLMLTRSFDNGYRWKKAVNLLLPFPAESMNGMTLLPGNSGFTAVLGNDALFSIDLPAPSSPVLLTPDDLISATSEVTVKIMPVKDPDDLQYTLALSQDSLFSPGSYQEVAPAGFSFRMPVSLKDGRYYYRIDLSDAFSAVSSKVRSFTLDRVKPILTIISPSDNSTAETGEIAVSGTTEADAVLIINGSKIFLGAAGFFNTRQILKAGPNIMTFEAADLAGNRSTLTRTVYYMPASADLALNKPSEKDWVRPGTTIAMEAQFLTDHLIEDEQEAAITFSGSTAESSLAYDLISDRISGFVKLPQWLPHGKNSFTLSIADKNGSVKKSTLNINIDSKSPTVVLSAPGDKIFSNRIDAVIAPIADEGAGADPSGTKGRLSCGGVTVETTASFDKSSSSVVLYPEKPLKDGLYCLEINTRDLAGNSGTPAKYNYIVDTVPPVLTLSKEIPAETGTGTIEIAGKADKTFISTFSILVNEKPAKGISVKNNEFSASVNLENGSNNITVSVCDLAGNKTSISGKTLYIAPADVDMSISNLLACPNPFDPASGSAAITFDCSKDSTVTLYVFDIKGSLVCKKSGTAVSGFNKDLTWDGNNSFGEALSNGTYIIRVAAKDASGGSSTSKSRIILLR
ncbi:MAG: hypothetical protein NTZ10_03165 [Candidatus Saganbacteria bacterium]|nr:hypothetical protein [Candidatus Saganbacteria bacterium]